MPQIVQTPKGAVQFPDGMSHDDIEKALDEEFHPQVGAGEAVQRTLTSAGHHALAAFHMAAGGLAAAAGDTTAADQAFKDADTQTQKAHEADIQPGEETTIGGKVAGFAASVPGGLVGATDILSEPGRQVVQQGGSTGQAAKAELAAAPAAAIQFAAPELGGRVGARLAEAGLKRLAAKAAGGAAASAVAAPAAHAIANIGLPDNLKQPLAPTVQDVAFGALGAFAKNPEVKVPASTAVADTVGAAVKTLGGNDQLATVLGQHAAAHADANGVAPHAGVHSDAAVDAVPDKDLQALSPKYKWLRDRGTPEVEAKGALKSALQEKITNLTPETKTVDEAFGGTATLGEEWGADIKPPNPNAGFPEDALIEKINRHKAETNNGTIRKELDKKIADLTTAREWRRIAALARSEGDVDTALDYLKRAEKINPTAETVNIDSGEAPTKPGQGGPLVERRGLAKTPESDVVDSEATPGTAPKALPAPPPAALPPRAATPVTPEGQAITPDDRAQAQASGLTPDVQRAAAAHPGAPEPTVPPPPNTDVSTAVGMAGGMARGGKRTLISRMIPQFLDVPTRSGGTARVNVWDEIHAHENAEFPNIKDKGYLNAHDQDGNAATAAYLERYDVDPRAYQNVLRPHLKAAELDALQHPEDVDPTLDHRPYAPQKEAPGKAPKGDDTHMLGENHPYNQGRTAPELVQRRATRTAARIAELEQENADRNAAERPAGGDVQSGNRVQPGPEAEAPVGNRSENAVGEAAVGDSNAAGNRAEISTGQHARTETGAAPQEDGGQVRREESAPDRRGDRNVEEPSAQEAGNRRPAEEVTPNADAGTVRTGGAENPPRPGEKAGDAGAAPGDGQSQHEGRDQARGGGAEGKGGPEDVAFQRSDATETPEFKRWFGHSKVVDSSGAPLVVYHGTDADVEAFDKKKMREGRYGKAFHFTDDPERAAAYGKNVMPVYLKMERPNDRASGDGMIIGSEPGKRIFLVRDPKQIKSAIGNRGTFDPADPRIAFQRGDHVRGGMLRKNIEGIAAHVTRLWRNAPRVVVHDSFDADTIHPDVRRANADQQARGAKGEPAAWFHQGEIHINAKAMRDTRHVIEAIFHEGIGHGGLRSVFGDSFNAALDDFYKTNKADVNAQAKAEGLDTSTDFGRRRAAEEFIADRAKPNQTLGPMAKVVSWIRGWLRNNLTAFRGMKFSDAEIVQHFIEPAKRFVESGRGRQTNVPGDAGRSGVPGQTANAQPRTDGVGPGEPEDSGPAFMRETDSPADLQSKAREAADAIGEAIKETGGRIFSGSMDIARKLGQQGLRAALANAIRADTKARYMLKGVRDYADRLIGKNPNAVRQATAAWEQGKPILDPTLRDFFAKAQKYGDDMVEQVRLTGKEMGYIANYLPHLYKDPKRAAEVFYNYLQSRPLRTGGFTKQRFHETLEAARASGLEPISENPVDLFLAHWSQMHKYVEMAKFKDHLDTHGLLEDEPSSKYRMPPGWAKINDPLFQGKIAPEGVAKDVNNHLSEGLYQYKGWRGFRAAQNLLLRTRLTASLYHAGMTTVDSVLSHSSIGFQRALLGDYKGAATSLANAAGALPQAAIDLAGKGAGSKLVEQFLGIKPTDPETALIFDKLTRGGSRVFMEKTDTNDAITQFHRAMMQGKYTQAAGRAFGAGVEAMTHHIAQKLVPAQKMIARVELFKLELDRRAEELGAKRGDYAGIMDKMNPDFIDHIAAKVSDNVDDRLGQFAYDNLFMNRMVRDALGATIQSPGWNLGSGRLIFGGLKDIKQMISPDKVGIPLDKAGKITDVTGPRLTSRLAYLMTMNAAIMGFNGMMTALLTGTPPSGKDFWYFRTGAKNADGSDERMNLPSYMRDEYGVLHPSHLGAMVTSKLHPALSMAFEVARNEDYFGNEIHNPQDRWPAQAKQYLDYFAKGVEPYALQNQQRNLQAGGGAARSIAPFFGVTPAPAGIARSKFQQGVVEAMGQNQHETNRTPEQAEHGRELAQATTAVRAGDRSGLPALSEKDRQEVLKRARLDVNEYRFAHELTLQQQTNLYDEATPEEREKYKLLQHINQHLVSARGHHELSAMDPEDAKALRDRIRALRQ